MLRRITSTIVQSRGIKNTVNVKWVRPEYVPSYKPEKSGDLEGLPAIPENTIGRDYALTEEIKDLLHSMPKLAGPNRIPALVVYNQQDAELGPVYVIIAPEAVKKIFSVAHLGKKEFSVLVKQQLTERVKRHKYDENTAETKIASLTGHIRCLQDTMDKFPRNKKMKIVAQELIDRRKKLLKFLRQYDYKKFEWLLEKLNIEYKGHPESYNKLSRKESLRKLTEMHCEELRNKKLSDYRNLLESQQGPFLKQKLEALQFIRSEQIELEVPITVTEQDIKKVAQQLEEWTIKDEIKQQAKKKKKNILLDLD